MEEQNDQGKRRKRGGQHDNSNHLKHGGYVAKSAIREARRTRLDGRTRAGKAVARICRDLGNATEMQQRSAKAYVRIDDVLERFFTGVRSWSPVSRRKRTAAPWVETVIRLGNLNIQYGQLLGVERREANRLDLARRLQLQSMQNNGSQEKL